MDSLTIRLSAPRGFCAGVDRAIQIVEEALRKWGPPVYVRPEIVHNAHVVDGLRAKGAIFVEELSECPDDRPVIFSAHGVPKSVPAEASTREMIYVDATCPLVSKVHVEAQKHFDSQRDILLIGHAGHPEVVGTMGQLPEGCVAPALPNYLCTSQRRHLLRDHQPSGSGQSHGRRRRPCSGDWR